VDKEFITRMQDELIRQKEEILMHLMSDNEDFKAIVEDIAPKDLADVAADDIDKKNLEALGTVELKRLRLIDSALGRIQNDRYGVCMECGCVIPRTRLEAIPYALMCIECQSKKERQNR